jgi:hypothetical protein
MHAPDKAKERDLLVLALSLRCLLVASTTYLGNDTRLLDVATPRFQDRIEGNSGVNSYQRDWLLLAERFSGG